MTITSNSLAVTSREYALALDAADPLAAFRSRYLPQTDDVVAYLDGNSLGRPLAAIPGRTWRTVSGRAG
jgi:kynureninase